MKHVLKKCLLSGAFGIATSAGAQQTITPPASPDDSNALNTIMVTAQRRSEALQTVPISVATLTAETLASNHIRTSTDLTSITAGLQFNASGGAANIYLRGVGHNNAALGDESAVAVNIDGVYVPTNWGNIFSLNNVQQIDVLKGPQGTLFGRNASGGVIQITTKDPSHTTALNAEIGYGSYDTIEGKFYGTTGLTDTLAVDLAVTGEDQRQGYGRNVTLNIPLYRQRNWSIRSKLLWQPSYATSVTFAISNSHNENDIPSSLIYPGTVASNGQRSIGFFTSQANIPGHIQVDHPVVSLKVDHDFGNFQVSNILAFQSVDPNVSLDIDGTSTPFINARSTGFESTITEEFQILSSKGAPITWVVGAFYMYDIAEQRNNQDGSLVLPPPFQGKFLATGRQKTDSYSIFAQATANLGQDTHLTLGLRYTSDVRKETSLTVGGLVNQFIAQAATYNKLTYRAALDHRITPDVLVYISANRGFKSGVFNLTSPAAAPVAPEVVDAYEFGIKSEFLDRRVRINASAFYYDYTGIQLRQVVAGSAVLTNAANSRIKGIDLEVEGRITRRFSVSAVAEILDPVFTSYPGALISSPLPAGGNLIVAGSAAGNQLIQAPRFSSTLSATWRAQTAIGEVTLAGNWRYTARYFWDPDNRLDQPATSIVNASLRLMSRNERWDLSVWGANLLDKRYFLTAAGTSSIASAAIPAPPRTVGATFGIHFR